MANRVWFDARSLSRRYTTGWERYVRELGNHLPKLIDATFWTPNTNNRLALLISDFQTAKSQSGHQVVHFPTYPPRSKNNEISQIITVHDLTWWKYPETSSFLGKNYYKQNMSNAILQSELIICPSNAIKKEIHQKFSIPTNKIIAIPHGNSLPIGIKRSPSKPYFLSIGTIEPRKNLDFYAQAIAETGLLNSFDFIHVVFVDDEGDAARVVDIVDVQLLQCRGLVAVGLALEPEEPTPVADDDVRHTACAVTTRHWVEVVGPQHFQLGDHLGFDFLLRCSCHVTPP